MQIRNLRWTATRPAVPEGIMPFLVSLPGTELPPAGTGLTTDGELAPRDEAVLLLQLAAEIEHSLMVQYLYAALSLELDQSAMRGSGVPANAALTTQSWQSSILRIAKQEMGHLVTVQNLLRAIGGVLHFGREDFPFTASGFYPFRFTLEPMTKDVLAKFIAAERPEQPDPTILPPEKEAAILKRAKAEAGGDVNRVGVLYARLIEIFKGLPADKTVFLSDTDELQASPESEAWRGGSSGDHVLVRNLTGSPEVMRDQAQAALKDIAEQGEGIVVDDPNRASAHFRVFLDIYDAFPEDGGTWTPSRPVPVNPAIAPEDGTPPSETIGEPGSRRLAHLANVRYRMLLVYLQHTLRTPAASEARPLLFAWAFEEMRMIKLLATGLTKLPRTTGKPASEAAAAICFNMPYTIALPERDLDCWRLHRDLLDANDALLAKIGTAVLKAVDSAGLLTSYADGRRPAVNRQLGN
jgi:hypothetical protein